MGLLRYVGWGALAGAAGTTALDAATYLDMAYGAVTVATLDGLERD